MNKILLIISAIMLGNYPINSCIKGNTQDIDDKNYFQYNSLTGGK